MEQGMKRVTVEAPQDLWERPMEEIMEYAGNTWLTLEKPDGTYGPRPEHIAVIDKLLPGAEWVLNNLWTMADGQYHAGQDPDWKGIIRNAYLLVNHMREAKFGPDTKLLDLPPEDVG